MNIIEFARDHKLRLERFKADDDETDGYVCRVVNGRIGVSSIYEHSLDTTFAVMFMTDGKKPPRMGLFNTFKAACLAVGMTPLQVGDAEGSFLFDPSNQKQAKAAIKGIRARQKRRITPEQAAAGAARLQVARLARQKVENTKQEALI
jgi:hypothetical protein